MKWLAVGSLPALWQVWPSYIAPAFNSAIPRISGVAGVFQYQSGVAGGHIKQIAIYLNGLP